MSTGTEWLASVADRLRDELNNGAAPTPERLSVQELLSKFDYSRRGAGINNHIRNQLDHHKLRTKPDFEHVWIHAPISVELDEDGTGEPADTRPPDPTHRVDRLEAAHHPPLSVKPDARLQVATTYMMANDYSQLPVMQDERNVKGVISWKSIGFRTSLGCKGGCVRDYMDPAKEIPMNTPLFDAIGIIRESDYVLVRDQSSGNRVTGIVTASDLSSQFGQLAGPFMMVGEIEGHLRNIVHRKFTLDEMRNIYSEPEDSRKKEINGSSDLTFGEYYRLFSKPEYWQRMKLSVDRSVFLELLESARKTRNSIMHFSPDGLSDEEFQVLHNFSRYLDTLASLRAI